MIVVNEGVERNEKTAGKEFRRIDTGYTYCIIYSWYYFISFRTVIRVPFTNSPLKMLIIFISYIVV